MLPKPPVSGFSIAMSLFFFSAMMLSSFLHVLCVYIGHSVFALPFPCPEWPAVRHTGSKSKNIKVEVDEFVAPSRQI